MLLYSTTQFFASTLDMNHSYVICQKEILIDLADISIKHLVLHYYKLLQISSSNHGLLTNNPAGLIHGKNVLLDHSPLGRVLILCTTVITTTTGTWLYIWTHWGWNVNHRVEIAKSHRRNSSVKNQVEIVIHKLEIALNDIGYPKEVFKSQTFFFDTQRSFKGLEIIRNIAKYSIEFTFIYIQPNSNIDCWQCEIYISKPE